MTTEKIEDLEIVSIFDYFSPKTFRLIPADLICLNGGISEVPVTLNLHPDFTQKLNFDIRKLQKLYAFSIMEKKTLEINGGKYYSPEKDGKLKSMELNDCGKLWIFNIEWFSGESKLYAVKAEEVLQLLNNCRKPLIISS